MAMAMWGTSTDPLPPPPVEPVVYETTECRKCSGEARKLDTPAFEERFAGRYMRTGSDGLPEKALMPVADRFLCRDLDCGTVTKVRF
tara:strand:+ start:257 stop:517 length:261 start_codon:yes stop_codon:yes gene_type:complete